MHNVVISGTGIYLPPDTISNEELVESFNIYVDQHNNQFAKEIANGSKEALLKSRADFIEQASGIKQRHVINKQGILDPGLMHPIIPLRQDNQISVQCEFALPAAKEALKNANKSASDIDAIIIACSNLERAYPSLSIELQSALGIKAFGIDTTGGCAAAVFGISMAYSLIQSQLARSVLVVTPELYTCHLNFRDRKSHFIFGDGCSAVVLEDQSNCQSLYAYKISGIKLHSQFSNNIRNNFGFLNQCNIEKRFSFDKLFKQNGKKVREEIVPLATKHILEHLTEQGMSAQNISKLWLHQANIHINEQIVKNVFGCHQVTSEEAPSILSECGNTGAAGSIINFHKHHSLLPPQSMSVICAFGTGYSIGSILLEKK